MVTANGGRTDLPEPDYFGTPETVRDGRTYLWRWISPTPVDDPRSGYHGDHPAVQMRVTHFASRKRFEVEIKLVHAHGRGVVETFSYTNREWWWEHEERFPAGRYSRKRLDEIAAYAIANFDPTTFPADSGVADAWAQVFTAHQKEGVA